jgi:hexulose-6-phosphate isomerase
MTLGVMQGRLLSPVGGRIQAFPGAGWEREFQLAPLAGVELIEWIVDADGFEENPLLTASGRDRLRALEARTGTRVKTVCADCFMAWPLTMSDAGARARHVLALRRVIEAAAYAGLRAVTIPFVDESAIRSAEDRQAATLALAEGLRVAEDFAIDLALETSLGPRDFRSLLDALDHPRARVNYDCGNSASLGYDGGHEFDAYGDRIATVHIKDRVHGGGTVPLGTGAVDFSQLFARLTQIGYAGPLILQVARGGDEVSTVRAYADFVRSRMPARLGAPAPVTLHGSRTAG